MVLSVDLSKGKIRFSIKYVDNLVIDPTIPMVIFIKVF